MKRASSRCSRSGRQTSRPLCRRRRRRAPPAAAVAPLPPLPPARPRSSNSACLPSPKSGAFSVRIISPYLLKFSPRRRSMDRCAATLKALPTSRTLALGSASSRKSSFASLARHGRAG